MFSKKRSFLDKFVVTEWFLSFRYRGTDSKTFFVIVALRENILLSFLKQLHFSEKLSSVFF